MARPALSEIHEQVSMLDVEGSVAFRNHDLPNFEAMRFALIYSYLFFHHEVVDPSDPSTLPASRAASEAASPNQACRQNFWWSKFETYSSPPRYHDWPISHQSATLTEIWPTRRPRSLTNRQTSTDGILHTTVIPLHLRRRWLEVLLSRVAIQTSTCMVRSERAEYLR